jgi:ribosomal-protein-alanine N-acetyltransferase
MCIFETPRLIVRPLTEMDFEPFFLLNGDAEVMQYIRSPQTREEALAFLKENIAYYCDHPRFGRWTMMEKPKKEFAGSFMLRPSILVSGKIELGYALLKPFWGRGLATESVRGALQYAFGELFLPDLIAITHPENRASQSVLNKCAFRFSREMEENGKKVSLYEIHNSVV